MQDSLSLHFIFSRQFCQIATEFWRYAYREYMIRLTYKTVNLIKTFFRRRVRVSVQDVLAAFQMTRDVESPVGKLLNHKNVTVVVGTTEHKTTAPAVNDPTQPHHLEKSLVVKPQRVVPFGLTRSFIDGGHVPASTSRR